MREIGNILPFPTYVNIPIQLRFKIIQPKTIPNLMDPTMALFHNLTVTMDLHGGVNMEEYVRTALNGILNIFKLMGADFFRKKLLIKSTRIMQY
jgi:hypothetical protein